MDQYTKVLSEQFVSFVQEHLGNIDELVYNHLSCEYGIIENYDKRFFQNLVAYAFIKNKLDILEHGMPSIHISNILDRFATNEVKFLGDLKYFTDIVEKLDLKTKLEKFDLLNFCDNFIFYEGLYPQMFHSRIVSPKFYNMMAKRFFGILQQEKGDIYYLMKNNLDRYIGALNFMKEKLLEGEIILPKEDVIN